MAGPPERRRDARRVALLFVNSKPQRANELRECASHPLDESVVPVFAAGQYQSRMAARMVALFHNGE
jgi:hypothetical protein